MILADSHAHSQYSFDGPGASTVDAICAEYIEKGFSVAALTDHYDVDYIEDGLYSPYDVDDARRDYEAAAEKYAGRFDLVWGVELGQAPFRPESARHFVREHGFEFVIGSIHNLDMCPDFYYIGYANMPDEMIRRLYARYVEALFAVVRFGGIHTLAHVTYPIRYIHRDGRTLDIAEFYDDYRQLFRELIDAGIALEVNTAKVRTGYVTSPDVDLIELYRDCGGTRVTVGSDGHRPGDFGEDVADTIAKLGALGFKELVIPSHCGTRTIPIE